MAGSSDSTHVTEEDLEKLHAQGRCLTRHQQRTQGHKCSHQWQAKVRAEGADRGLYEHPKYHSLCGQGRWRTAAQQAASGRYFPRGYGILRNRPKCGDWDPGGQNFEHFIRPYWHNAHHIVPNRALDNAIQVAGEEDARIPNLIKAGLLKADYNLNDELNMIILPMERLIAATLGLPRHLKRDEGGPGSPSSVPIRTTASRWRTASRR